VPAFRRLWSADLFSAWGAEMETIILGWYVLMRTDSAFLVSLVAALRFGGTLVAPAAGVLADRVSRRTLLISLRIVFAVLAASLALADLAGALPLAWVFVVAAGAGLLRPAEMILRQSLIADVVPPAMLTNALGFGRTTIESARVAGPLLGAGLLSALGIGIAYAAVTVMYLASVAASVRIRLAPLARASTARPWAELLEGLRYMRGSPPIVVCMTLAFTVNFTAFPVTMGLLPVIARDAFGADANGLARMVAVSAAGALAGSVAVAVATRNLRPERVMLACLAAWHLLIAAFAITESATLAYLLLAAVGLATGGGMIPLAVVLMTRAAPEYRGRVMGVRQLAVYGLPLGLLLAGALIEWLGIGPTLLLYATLGLLPVLAAALGLSRWSGG